MAGRIITDRLRIAARENGKKGGRPKEGAALARLKKIRLLASERGRMELDECIKFLVAVRDNTEAPWESRLRATENLLDRFGLCRKQIEGVIGEDSPKLVEMGDFPDPPGWLKDPSTNGHSAAER